MILPTLSISPLSLSYQLYTATQLRPLPLMLLCASVMGKPRDQVAAVHCRRNHAHHATLWLISKLLLNLQLLLRA